MATGLKGTFVISWAQTAIDGYEAAPISYLGVGSPWSWSGQVVRLDGAHDVLRLEDADDEIQLRQRAAHMVRKMVGAAKAQTTDLERIEVSDPIKDRSFVVTDGRKTYTVTLIEVAGSAPLAMFIDKIPPADTDLWVVQHSLLEDPNALASENPGGVICFTPGTMLRTADGLIDVAQLRPGDKVQTKDNGLQEVMWRGSRRVSGARMHVQPHLAPVRIRAAALGGGRPEVDLLVSPEHRMLIQGAKARALFNTDEVLIAARDLVDERQVFIDRSLRSVTYVHVLFEQHQILWANGVETESFHPATAALDQIEPDQKSALMRSLGTGPENYGGYARRSLSPSEAAILRHVA